MTSLLDIWLGKKDFLESKTVEQLVSIAGDGRLRDGSDTSSQLRELFSNVPSHLLARYISECLSSAFDQSGLVLQDVVNELGRRLGFDVEHGYYRGSTSRIGHDGIWRGRDGHCFVIEVKTTTAYQLDLDVQAEYRNRLIKEERIDKENSSILIIAGRNDTGGLEAQTRGSKHAWDVRIISAEALLKLLKVKENLNEPGTVTRIQGVLKPLEYTRVDRLIDIIFSTSEDLQSEEENVEGDPPPSPSVAAEKPTVSRANFNQACMSRVSKKLGVPLVKDGRCNYTSADHSTRVVCIVSKEYLRNGLIRYWYAFHPSQKEFLSSSSSAFVALGCGSADAVMLVPATVFFDQLPSMRTTSSDDRFYWHVEIFIKDGKYLLNKSTADGVDITSYKLP
jgi:hypothetical protein